MIFPWPVGRYNSPDAARAVAQTERAPDIEWAREHNKAYMAGIFPGFSWHNLMQARGKDAKMDEIPRLGGEFLWAQAVSAKRAGASMIYVAMFDEIDEGTAILQSLPMIRPPAKLRWLTLRRFTVRSLPVAFRPNRPNAARRNSRGRRDADTQTHENHSRF